MKPLNESHNNENPETVKSLNVASIRKSGKRYLMSVIIARLPDFLSLQYWVSARGLGGADRQQVRHYPQASRKVTRSPWGAPHHLPTPTTGSWKRGTCVERTTNGSDRYAGPERMKVQSPMTCTSVKLSTLKD